MSRRASSAVGGEWETDYRTRIRKMPTRTAVDDLYDEVRRTAATRGRMCAIRLLRQKVPELGYAEVIEYVSAVQGGSVPGPLTAIAAEALVPGLNPVLRVHTIQPCA